MYCQTTKYRHRSKTSCPRDDNQMILGELKRIIWLSVDIKTSLFNCLDEKIMLVILVNTIKNQFKIAFPPAAQFYLHTSEWFFNSTIFSNILRLNFLYYNT